jgi:hypothetical protein
MVTYKGVDYKNITTLGKAFNLSPDAARYRWQNNIPMEHKKLTDGKSYHTRSKDNPLRQWRPTQFSKKAMSTDQRLAVIKYTALAKENNKE